MKDIFGVNCKTNEYECEKYAVKKIDQLMKRKLERQMEEVNNFNKKVKIPNWLNLLQSFGFYGGIIALMLVLMDSVDSSVGEAIKNNLIIFIVWIILALIGIAATFYKKNIQKKYINSKEYIEHNEKTKTVIKEALNHLGVPKKGVEVDIYGELFEVKDNQKHQASPSFTHVNNSFIIYKDIENLYFADATSVYAFNLKDIVDLKRIEKKITIYGWNKPESPRNKMFGLKVSAMGAIVVKEFYSLELNVNGEEIVITIPPYEIEHFKNLLNIEIK